jgi:hypothetical protein
MTFSTFNDDTREYGPQLALDLIYRAAIEGHLAVLQCKDKAGQDIHVLVAAVPENKSDPNGATRMWPLARIFDGDPFTEVNPPEGAELIDLSKPLH